MTGSYGVLFAALVLPGGLLILACALYRWLVRRTVRRREPPRDNHHTGCP